MGIFIDTYITIGIVVLIMITIIIKPTGIVNFIDNKFNEIDKKHTIVSDVAAYIFFILTVILIWPKIIIDSLSFRR